MAKIRWTVGARRDLHELINFIAEDSPAYALHVAERVLLAVDRLQTFPKLGRMVPEYHNASVRELIVGNYRIVYKIQGSRIGIAAIAHASRELLRKLPSAPWDIS